MASTTNYSWVTPDDSALVKDGAAAIRTLGSSIDTTTKALNPSTTLGDIEYRSSTANTNTRLGIGTNGQVLTVASGVPAWQTPTNTNLTFTQRLAAPGTNFNQIAYNGTNLWVAVGNSGQLYTSTNGTTWTSRTSGFGTNAIYDVAFGNGLWVAVGVNGTITTSTDGTTWTARTSNMSTNTIQAVTYANSLWVAVGDGGGATNTGGIIYSSDGLTWTRKSQTPTVGALYYCVVWNGTNWIVGANVSTNNYLYASTPSGTWTAAATGSGNEVVSIFWDGTRHTTIEGVTAKTARYSTSTTLGTTTAMDAFTIRSIVAQTFNGILKLYNNKIYGTFGGYIQSFTPTSSVYPAIDPGYLAPVRMQVTSTSPIIAVPVNDGAAMWVGAAGIIWSNYAGAIYSTF